MNAISVWGAIASTVGRFGKMRRELISQGLMYTLISLFVLLAVPLVRFLI